jgi:GNAT superfamily N-acetyltransferase
MTDIKLDYLRGSDADDVVRLLGRSLTKETISSAEFCRKVLLDPNFRPEGAVTARLDGKIAGFILSIIRRQPLEDGAPDFKNGWITLLGVDPAYRKLGIGGELLQSALSYLRAGGVSSAWVSPYAPNYFSPGVDEAAYPEGIEFLKRHGFETAYRPLSMEGCLEKLEVPAEVERTEAGLIERGIAIRELRLGDVIALLEFVRMEFPGDWQRLVRESIDRIAVTSNPRTRIFIAVRDGRCIGFARHDGERFGPFGVGFSARGMGIGGALLFRCLESMKRDGMKKAWLLWTDDRAARLYIRAGFSETRRYSVMKRDI